MKKPYAQPAHESQPSAPQETRSPETQSPETAKPRARGPRDRADYDRRLRAAGIDLDAELPEDLDEFRLSLARRISMFVNEWHGCPEGLCRRQRGCMAPNNRCSNTTLPPDPDGKNWEEARLKIRRALDDFIKEHGREDE